MPREVVCPHCGSAVPLEGTNEVIEPELAGGSVEVSPTLETVLPATLAQDSPEPEPALPTGDSANVLFASPTSDEVVEVFVAGDALFTSSSTERAVLVEEASTPPDAAGDKPGRDPFLAALVGSNGSHVRDEGATAAIPAAERREPAPDAALEPVPERLPGRDLPPDATAASPSTATTPAQASDQEELDEEEVTGLSWPMVLLASYASAVTLALFWVVWTGRGIRGEVGPPTLPVDSRPELEAGGGAKFLAELPAIPEDRLATIGQTLHLGNLELTPLEVRLDRVELRSVAGPGRREGGEKALKLRLRVKNVSPDTAFVPLEPAFVRQPDRGSPASVIASKSDQPVFTYPLAIESEWAIVGQEFPKLEPGQQREVVVVSEAGALDRLEPPMTWRVKLRTGANQTAVIGVSIEPDQILR